MDVYRIRALLNGVATGVVAPEEAERRLVELPFSELTEQGVGFARIDHHRELRCGFPETIYGAGKTPDQVAATSPVRLVSSGWVSATYQGME